MVLTLSNSLQLLGLELVKIIQFTLPYVMLSPASGFEAQANEIGRAHV